MKSAIVCFMSLLPLALSLGRPRGVSIERASLYVGKEFKCLSGGQAMTMDYVNDDYCDCKDGSDEPGTPACSNGLFYCENKFYKGTYLISSRVNDGICDCCDGSDEYDGTISCEDTCEQLYAERKAQLEEFKQKQEKGYKVKLEYMQQGHRTKDEKISRLSELSKEKDAFVEVRNTLQAVKDQTEAPEKEAKERHEKAWEAVKAERQKVQDGEKASIAFSELNINQDSVVDYPELMKHSEFDIDSDGTVSVEEAKEYLEDSEQVDLPTFITKIWPNIKEIYKSKASKAEPDEPERVPDEGEKAGDPDKGNIPPDDISEGGPEDYHDKYDDEDVDGDDDDGDGDEEDVDAEYTISSRNKRKKSSHLLNTVSDEEKMPDFDDATKKLIAAADEVRRKFEEADSNVKDVENEISAIKKYLELDLGPNEEFSALKGQCFEYSDREYIYRLCPFDKTSQKAKSGGIETNLGVWGHWYGPEEDKYDSMKYENGQGCWNGPNRSCHVNLHCGAENALTGASEPSRCEYQFEFTTPARCSQPEPVASPDVHEEL
uniref:Glucosidase 2 subunit beta n=1 Tax=Arion vulgaris TaxID=1028688 RepID=A0A0B6ZYE8_9EUPU